MSVYLTVLSKRSMKWSRLMSSNPRLKKNKRLLLYTRKGIPMSLRAQVRQLYMNLQKKSFDIVFCNHFVCIQVWTSVSGVQALKDEYGSDLYKQMLNKPLNEEIKNVLTVDMPRTFPDNIYFYPSSENQSALFRILSAFAAHNPYIGYCQVLKLKPIILNYIRSGVKILQKKLHCLKLL